MGLWFHSGSLVRRVLVDFVLMLEFGVIKTNFSRKQCCLLLLLLLTMMMLLDEDRGWWWWWWWWWWWSWNDKLLLMIMVMIIEWRSQISMILMVICSNLLLAEERKRYRFRCCLGGEKHPCIRGSCRPLHCFGARLTTEREVKKPVICIVLIL